MCDKEHYAVSIDRACQRGSPPGIFPVGHASERPDRSEQQRSGNGKKECNSQLAALDRKIEELTKSGSERYLKYRKGELSEGVFLKEKEELGQRRALLQKQRLDATERLRTIEVQTAEKNHFLRALARGRGKAELTAEVLETLIHRIEVYPDHRIKVIFAFKRSDFTGGLQG